MKFHVTPDDPKYQPQAEILEDIFNRPELLSAIVLQAEQQMNGVCPPSTKWNSGNGPMKKITPKRVHDLLSSFEIYNIPMVCEVARDGSILISFPNPNLRLRSIEPIE